MSDENRAGAAADVLWNAWSTGERITGLPTHLRPGDATGGMAVQRALAAHAGPSYGWKVAATNTAGQAHIGVTGPLPGLLFDRFRHEPGEVLPSGDLHMRVVEAEFAYRMGADVAPGAGSEDVLAAVDGLHLAVEVPDSRFTRFETAGAAQLRADCACAGRFVLGPDVPGWRDLDLSTWGTAVWINGTQAATGSGGAVLGDPRTALAWIAEDLHRHGLRLRAGDVVTTGTTTAPVPVAPGDAVRADFGGLGEVAFRFGA
ncbi:2-keto-4-pentenoate hydratase [Pseudonocardia kunmingensis]|uniref:2-keto-4-pentenoate hydratase n=1 Tax=Pseudonocardia kunmingensis TaxID=630975 RepID=A0A543DAI1_9PSEU|nr:fumarylacetoacetate hydrolase family protein [Pseudonocardia kunmingensis]TQM06295.1 2-keto-4-pentenoate hydratase [Pseudonocardia kunmingensis]